MFIKVNEKEFRVTKTLFYDSIIIKKNGCVKEILIDYTLLKDYIFFCYIKNSTYFYWIDKKDWVNS